MKLAAEGWSIFSTLGPGGESPAAQGKMTAKASAGVRQNSAATRVNVPELRIRCRESNRVAKCTKGVWEFLVKPCSMQVSVSLTVEDCTMVKMLPQGL